MGFQRNLKTNKGFSFIELLIVLSLMGTGTMFVLKNYQDKTNAAEGKSQASRILLFLDTVKSFDPAENYQRKAGSYPLSPDEQTFVDNALATGFNDLSPDFIDYQIKMAFGEEKRTAWKAPISATTDVQEFSIITGLPKNTRGCLSFLSELSKPPVHSVGYSGGLYKISSDKPNEFISICSNISGKKFKKVSINYCNFLDGKDCSNKP